MILFDGKRVRFATWLMLDGNGWEYKRCFDRLWESAPITSRVAKTTFPAVNLVDALRPESVERVPCHLIILFAPGLAPGSSHRPIGFVEASGIGKLASELNSYINRPIPYYLGGMYSFGVIIRYGLRG